MCSVIAGLTALSGYTQYRSQQQAANAQAAAYRAQAQAAEQNAKIENRRQEQIADNYAQQQQALRARHRLAEGQTRAAAGAAGLNIGGSVMDILGSSGEAAQQDQLNLLNNQRNDNYNSRVAESNYINQANAANASAANVKRAARMQGLGTILGTAASIYGIQQANKKPDTGTSSTGGSVGMGYGNNANIGKNTTDTSFANKGGWFDMGYANNPSAVRMFYQPNQPLQFVSPWAEKRKSMLTGYNANKGWF